MFDVVCPVTNPCTMCAGEGYALVHMSEIWVHGYRIRPFSDEVFMFCVYCMGTGDGNRQILEQFRYIDMYENISKEKKAVLEKVTTRALMNMRQIQKEAEEGTLSKRFCPSEPSRMECYDWDFDFEKMRRYPDSIILKAKEKENKNG